MASSVAGPEESEFAAAARNAVGDHATADDSLGFAPYVEAIAAFLTSDATEPPLTISIEGEWGSGKSSFMLQLEKAIAGPSSRAVFFKELPTRFGGFTTPGSVWGAIQAALNHKTRPTIQFNAWRHDKQDALWAAFALSVSRRLRERVGFFRAWYGDLHLFFLRLRGLRGWLELLLLIVSAIALIFSASILYHHFFANGVYEAVKSLSQLTIEEKNAKLDHLYSLLLTREAAVHGSWGALFLVAIAGFVKFHDQFKLPISIDLKKYLSTPDYQGHAAFIESFHEDFTRLLRAYSGNERVFIFIDDLDRCDVPRAAELMQAINLMISDAGRLIFVIGMDREKVAAGITQKYKDLLSFLPEYAAGLTPSLAAGSGSNPLAFGYSYLEKFIQLSFTLPVIAGREALDKFLDAMLPKRPPLTWKRQMAWYWTPRLAEYPWLAKQFRGFFGSPIEPVPPRSQAGDSVVGEAPVPPLPLDMPNTNAASAANSAGSEAIKAEARIRNLRIKIAEDSKGVRSIVSMVSTMFENNPRRLKQFVSTLRLALALSSEQGILDLDPARSGVTPQQLGKFVALTMKFPDLRVALAEESDLLGWLEHDARHWQNDATPSEQYWRWLNKKAVRDVLLYGVRDTSSDPAGDATSSSEPPNPFTLIGLDVTRLMSLLPKVPAPPEPISASNEFGAAEQPLNSGPASEQSTGLDVTQEQLLQKFDALATQYETVRATQQAGPFRTSAMTDLVHEVQQQISEYSPQAVSSVLRAQIAKNSDGNRIVALGIASERIDQGNMFWLVRFLADFRSAFEHYWTIRALLLHHKYITFDIAGDIAATLDRLRPEIAKDPGRVEEAESLRGLVYSILEPSALPSEDYR